MSATSISQNVPGSSPDIYEGSYEEIFTHINFNFLVFFQAKPKREVGRPRFPEGALFKAILLKNLTLNSSFRTIEAMLTQDSELAELLGFAPFKVPSDSVLRCFFARLKLKESQTIHNHLLKELRALGYAQGRIIVLDSTPIEAHCKKPMKKGAPAKVPDAR
ncbi:MAG: transposase [Candidatus Helarchaeota archaeon]